MDGVKFECNDIISLYNMKNYFKRRDGLSVYDILIYYIIFILLLLIINRVAGKLN